MARPLQDGSRAEPTAAVSGSPAAAAFPLGGTVAVSPSVCQPHLAALPPRLNCSLCPASALAPLPRSLYRCVRGHEPPRSRASGARGHGARQPDSNRHHLLLLPGGPAPSLEQAIGSRLRHMGDQFQQEREEQQQQQQQAPPPGPPGSLWDHVYHFVFQLLGGLYNLPAEGLLRPN